MADPAVILGALVAGLALLASGSRERSGGGAGGDTDTLTGAPPATGPGPGGNPAPDPGPLGTMTPQANEFASAGYDPRLATFVDGGESEPWEDPRPAPGSAYVDPGRWPDNRSPVTRDQSGYINRVAVGKVPAGSRYLVPYGRGPQGDTFLRFLLPREESIPPTADAYAPTGVRVDPRDVFRREGLSAGDVLWLASTSAVREAFGRPEYQPVGSQQIDGPVRWFGIPATEIEPFLYGLAPYLAPGRLRWLSRNRDRWSTTEVVRELNLAARRAMYGWGGYLGGSRSAIPQVAALFTAPDESRSELKAATLPQAGLTAGPGLLILGLDLPDIPNHAPLAARVKLGGAP